MGKTLMPSDPRRGWWRRGGMGGTKVRGQRGSIRRLRPRIDGWLVLRVLRYSDLRLRLIYSAKTRKPGSDLFFVLQSPHFFFPVIFIAVMASNSS
jgi:hypothetical protein